MPTCIESRSTKEFKRICTDEYKRVTGVHWRGSYVIFTRVNTGWARRSEYSSRQRGKEKEKERHADIRVARTTQRGCPRYPERVASNVPPPGPVSFEADQLPSRMPVRWNIDRTTSKYLGAFHTLLERPTQFYFVTARAVFASDDDRESSPYNGFIVERMLK